MNQRDGLSNENRRAFWQQAVALLQESGLTTSAFARREKLSPQTLNKWKIHFLGKDVRPDQRVPDSSTGLAVHENATGSGAASAGISAQGRCVGNSLNSVLVQEPFSVIQVVPEASAVNSDGNRSRRVGDSAEGLDSASAWQILVCGSRRIMIGNSGVPACLAEVVRVLESMESRDTGREDVC